MVALEHMRVSFPYIALSGRAVGSAGLRGWSFDDRVWQKQTGPVVTDPAQVIAVPL
jgi:hypothetical protein